jgi:SNF2 family DNA or RNA helicase
MQIVSSGAIDDFNSALRQYQREGVTFLYRSQSALLADDMGLGKTAQAICALRLILKRPEINRALVVAPSSLGLNWERELQRWAPELPVRRLLGTQSDRTAYYHLPVPVLVATYDQIRLDALDRIPDSTFDVVILDEAQRIKNYSSRTALACRLLPRQVAWALTGTPIENSRLDLESVFEFLSPGLLQRADDRATILRKIGPSFLRRRKSDVLSELPPILVQDLLLEMTDNQRAAYDAEWETASTGLRRGPHPAPAAALFAVITRLKQLCNLDPNSGESCKLDGLRVLLESAVSSQSKVIIFSQYVKTLKWLKDCLDPISAVIYSGEQSTTERDHILQQFESAAGPFVLLCSLRAGGVGLNIPSADLVILFDRWWNPALEDQAVNRAHRFGRISPLHVVRFLVRDSIEDRIQEILDEKRTVFMQYVEAVDKTEIDVLTRGELIRALGLSHYDTDIEASKLLEDTERGVQ